MLTPDDYGIIAIVAAVTGIFFIFCDVGLRGAIGTFYFNYYWDPERLRGYISTILLFLFPYSLAVTIVTGLWGPPLYSASCGGNSFQSLCFTGFGDRMLLCQWRPERMSMVALYKEFSTYKDPIDERVRQMEAKYDLLQYKVDNWCVWPLLRFSVYVQLSNPPLATRGALQRSEKIALVVKDIPSLISLRKARYFVKTYSSGLREQEGSLYKDFLLDDLLMDIGSYFKLEVVNNSTFIPRSRAALIKSDMTLMPFSLLAFLPIRAGVPRYISSLGSSLSACLRQEPGLEAFTPHRVTRALLHFYWFKRLYAWLLIRVRPEYVLTETICEYEITAAAKELGIKVIEFQHGAFDRYHPAYSWSAYALPYKANMSIPDRIFLYGEHWQRELEVNGFWDQEPRPVGSLRMDQYRKRRAIHRATGKDGCTIVLTTQGMDVERLIAFVADFLKVADGQLEFRLYIKLHPAYETGKALYEAAFQTDERVRVILGSEPPSTFELLTRANVHASISSTCHYEALALGVPTVILRLAMHEFVLPLYEAGHAFLARTPQDLLGIILQCRHYKVPDDIGEWYFKPGGLENIKRELGILPK